MRVQAIQADLATQKPRTSQRAEAHGTRSWPVLQQFKLVTSTVYCLLVLIWFDSVLRGAWTWRDVQSVMLLMPIPGTLMLASVALLLVIDHVDASFWKGRTAHSTAIHVMAVRILLIVVAVEAMRFMGSTQVPYAGRVNPWLPMCLLLAIPYTAAFYFEPRVSYGLGAAVWILATSHTLPEAFLELSARELEAFLVSAAPFTAALIGLTVIAKGTSDELRSRPDAESLLGAIQRAHLQLQLTVSQAITAIEERHQLARQIHHDLGHQLAAISVQIEKAVAFRTIDVVVADQAVRDAKQLGTDALQDVRRSVAKLRPQQDPMAPTSDHSVDVSTRHSWTRTWYGWLTPRHFDMPLAGWCLGYVAYELLLGSTGNLAEWQWTSLLAGVLGLILLDRLGFWFVGETASPYVVALLALIHIVLYGVVVSLGGVWIALLLWPLIPYVGLLALKFKVDQRPAVLISALYAVALLFSSLTEQPDDYFTVGLILVLFSALALFFFLLLVIWSSAPILTTRQVSSISSEPLLMLESYERTILESRTHDTPIERLMRDLEISHREVKFASEHKLADKEERIRLAHDLHDGLGHYLTVVNVQLEKALAFRAVDATMADEAIRDAQRLAAEALQDVRSTLGALSTSRANFSLSASLQQLIYNFGGSLKLNLCIAGSEELCSRQTLLVLYRVAQEALTNVQKHAQARSAWLDLNFTEDAVHLSICDDGCGLNITSLHRSSDARRGFGLQGMRERLEVVGGEIEIESRPGAGTRLTISIRRNPLERNGQTILPIGERV